MSRPSRRVRRERHPEDDNSSNHGNDYPSDSSLEEAGKIFSIKSNCRTNATNDDNTNNGGHVRRVEGEQRTGRGVLDGGRGATESARNGRRRRRGNVGDDATGCRAEDLKTYDPKSIGKQHGMHLTCASVRMSLRRFLRRLCGMPWLILSSPHGISWKFLVRTLMCRPARIASSAETKCFSARGASRWHASTLNFGESLFVPVTAQWT